MWKQQKTEASKLFKNGEYQEAIQQYNDALDGLLKSDMIAADEKSMESAKITSNISLMYLSILHNNNIDNLTIANAIKYAEKSISFNSCWAKGYLRLAQAKVLMSNNEEALDAMIQFMRLATDEERQSAAAKEMRYRLRLKSDPR